METRKITIVSSENNATYVVETDAETLGELKAAMQNAGITFNSTDEFREGITKTYLKDDSAKLPTNVSYKGTTTNNLVFTLVKPNKNISSGADRASVVAEMKAKHLEVAVKEAYGKSWTNCPTDAIAKVIAKNSNLAKTTTQANEGMQQRVPTTETTSTNELAEVKSELTALANSVFGIAKAVTRIEKKIDAICENQDIATFAIDDNEEDENPSQSTKKEEGNPYSAEELADILR